MKPRYALTAAGLALLLCGCQAVCPVEPVESGPAPPTETASVQPEEPPVPSEEPVPPEEPPPGSPEAILAQQPIDDTHDAFLVNTGGSLGTLLVTAELGELDKELWESPIHFSVWDPADMSRPIQEIEKMTFNGFHWHAELDANFDGYMDFSYMYAMGNQPNYWFLWVWDGDAGQFVEVPEYAQISSPYCNPETGIIDGWARSSGAGDGVTTFHRWEDGELICVRRIQSYCRWGEGEVSTVSVEDRVDGELRRVYYEEFPWNAEEIEGKELWRQAQYPWRDLSYHGEH